MRDPNMRMYMQNICQTSPMYDFVEEAVGREVKGNPTSNPAPQKKEEFEMPDFAAKYAGEFDETEIEHYENENVMQLMKMNITKEEVSSLIGC